MIPKTQYRQPPAPKPYCRRVCCPPGRLCNAWAWLSRMRPAMLRLLATFDYFRLLLTTFGYLLTTFGYFCLLLPTLWQCRQPPAPKPHCTLVCCPPAHLCHAGALVCRARPPMCRLLAYFCLLLPTLCQYRQRMAPKPHCRRAGCPPGHLCHTGARLIMIRPAMPRLLATFDYF